MKCAFCKEEIDYSKEPEDWPPCNFHEQCAEYLVFNGYGTPALSKAVVDYLSEHGDG